MTERIPFKKGGARRALDEVIEAHIERSGLPPAKALDLLTGTELARTVGCGVTTAFRALSEARERMCSAAQTTAAPAVQRELNEDEQALLVELRLLVTSPSPELGAKRDEVVRSREARETDAAHQARETDKC